MAVTIKGQAQLHGLQRAEQQTILGYFSTYFSQGTITITGYAKASMAMLVASGITTGAGIVVYFSGPGSAGKGGTEIFGVPGPEVGSGITFALAASLIGLFAYFRAKRSSAI